MDSYSPSSPIYRPGAESDWEEDIGTPVYRSPTPPATRPRVDVSADWTRNTGPETSNTWITPIKRPGRSQINYPNDHSGARLGDYLPSSGKLPEALAEISIYCL
ncbi:hypothetical protein L1987_30175 [Smallanthus sonchifolius]|uniref:Uncharacterized protein n=1 Tax=Smallanthus sonchifolius TaxID=185202 RepID=A0ACB9I3D8_9ASTR|nr:hypothetical protein L1987_30175 [Smallanthus sonchifolius]